MGWRSDWMRSSDAHVCVDAQDKWAAQRALYRDGEQLTRTTMIGVRPLDAVHMCAFFKPVSVRLCPLAVE